MAVILDVAIWALITWMVVRPPADEYGTARMCWHTTRACWAIASWFGRRAMQAERRYYREMELHR